MDAATPNSRFAEFNLDPALAETVETAPADQIVEGILRLEDPNEVPPLFSVVSRFNRICTGRFRATDTWTIRRHPNVISFKAARPLGVSSDGEDLAELVPPGETGMQPGPTAPFGGRGCIVAALDFGLDFAHPNFLNPDGTTRLVGFWHQGATYDEAHPNQYGYGRVFSREEINAALQSPDPYQALGYHPEISDTGNGSHGAHTLDIAAGNGRARGSHAATASEADLMFIHLSTPRLGAVGDLGDSVRVLEALDYVDQTARGRPWVVNLSVGRTAGCHDGTSLVEQGMHELLRLSPGRAIVQSAGNYQSANLCVQGWLRDGEHLDLEWIIDPEDTTGNEIDAWYSGKDRFVIAIRLPQGTAFVEVKLGDVADIVHEGVVVGRIYHRKNDPNNRDNHAEVFLYPGAPPGVWTVRLIGEYVISGRFHAWIERDLARPGAQSRFDAKITSQSYTLGTIATSPLVITVGAYDANAEGTPLAPFSSCGPTRDERRDKPELVAPGVGVVAARSIPRDALRQEGLLVARSGTSMAAPHVTGAVAAMFEAAGRPVSIDEIRDCLKRSAEPMTECEQADCCAWGRLNVEGAIREIQGSKTADLVSPPQGDLFAAGPPGMIFDSAFDTSVESFVGTSEIEAPSDEGDFMNIDGISRALEQAEQAAHNIGGGRRQSETSFLQELLRELDDRISVLGPSPAELFRAVLYNRPLMQDARKVLEVLAMPSQRPESALRPGDWMIRAVPGTGDVGHISVLTSGELLTQSMVAFEGIPSEGMQPGYYGLVIEAGAFPHSRARPFARKILDRRGLVPPNTVLLRPRYSDLGVMPDFPPYEPDGEAADPGVCTRYEKGEVEISHCQEGPCQQGHLVADVIRHPRGLLIADFGVGWSGVKALTKREKLLQDWMRELKHDLLSIKLRIYGYSDCVGAEKDNKELRRKRAEQAYGLLDKELQKRVEFAIAAPAGEYVADNETRQGRANNRGVIIELIRLPKEITCVGPGCPPPKPVPCTGPGCEPPPRPIPCKGPGCKPPPPPPKPGPEPHLPPYKPWVFPWRRPSVIITEPPPTGDPSSWMWHSVTAAASVLGITISIGMLTLSKAELATAIEAAWLVFQLEEGGLKIVIGMAGEAAAEAIIARVIGVDAAKVFNLNNLVKNFPVLDLIAPIGVFSVKTRGLLGLGAKLDAELVQEYTQDLINLAVGDHPLAERKLAKAARLLFDNSSALKKRGSWPSGFNPGSVQDVEKYIRNEAKLLVPHDHVQLLKRHVGSTLHGRVQRGLKLPAGVNPVNWVNSFVDRIDSIGVTTSDLQVMLEATKHLPKEQVERLQRELVALARERRGL